MRWLTEPMINNLTPAERDRYLGDRSTLIWTRGYNVGYEEGQKEDGYADGYQKGVADTVALYTKVMEPLDPKIKEWVNNAIQKAGEGD